MPRRAEFAIGEQLTEECLNCGARPGSCRAVNLVGPDKAKVFSLCEFCFPRAWSRQLAVMKKMLRSVYGEYQGEEQREPLPETRTLTAR